MIIFYEKYNNILILVRLRLSIQQV